MRFLKSFNIKDRGFNGQFWSSEFFFRFIDNEV